MAACWAGLRVMICNSSAGAIAVGLAAVRWVTRECEEAGLRSRNAPIAAANAMHDANSTVQRRGRIEKNRGMCASGVWGTKSTRRRLGWLLVAFHQTKTSFA